MIEIYLKTNTNYDKNGDITLEPTSCIYKDSEKEVTLEHFFDDEGRWKYIEFENVIAAEENGKKKFYRIYNVVRSLYSVTAYARPLFYDLLDKILLDVRPTKKLGQEALNIILADTPFIGHSNITKIGTAYYIRKNIVEALLGDDKNSFLNRWGGEFYCENFDVYINDRIGSDNGVRVEFGYNLNEIEEDINIENVVTRIIPVGYDGIMLEGNTPWVDSTLINKYTHIKMRVVEFSDVKVKENSEDEEGFNTIKEARTELINRCNKLFEEGIDKPTVNYKIDMINLANTTAYKDLKMLVEVNKGDTVTCYIKHLDIDVKARVIDYERDLITGEYTYIELGSVVDNFFNNQADIQNRVDNIFNSNGNVKAETLEGAINALQTQFKALRDIAQPQKVRAILFEDRIEDSPTFGCMCLGTMGFEIASSFKPGTNEWDFRTFGTGKGFVADHIITGILNAALIKAGILKSENEITWIDMENGTFNFADKVKFDGVNFEVDLSGNDLATNGSVDTKIEANNEGISTVITNVEKELKTQITQNAESIKEKVNASYVSQEITKSATETVFKFTNSGGRNLLWNSNFDNGLAHWEKSGSPPICQVGAYRANPYGKKVLALNTNARNQNVFQTLTGLVVGETYNISCYVYVARGQIVLMENNFWSGVYSKGTGWQWLEFNITPTSASVTIYIGSNEYTPVDNSIHVGAVQVTLGATRVQWQPNSGETYEGNTKMDKDGMEILNGGLKLKNKKNQEVFFADPAGNVTMGVYDSKLTISATGDRKTEMWCDYYDKFILQVPYTRVDGGIWIKRDTGATILSDLVTADNTHYKVYIGDFNSPSAKIANLYVTGTKNCLQATKTYGERLINAYETAEYYFGDIGSGVIKDGQCVVAIDDILQECVNTNIQYHVFTQVYDGSITKIERYPTYFVVYGSDNTEFSWELKAKRIGYENNRFDIVDDNNPERIDDFHSILDEGQYEDKYKIIEVENVLDSNPETSDISSILLEDVFLLENVLLGGM